MKKQPLRVGIIGDLHVNQNQKIYREEHIQDAFHETLLSRKRLTEDAASPSLAQEADTEASGQASAETEECKEQTSSYVDTINTYCDGDEAVEQVGLLLTGVPCCGKSTFLAGWVQQRREKVTDFIFHHHAGLSGESRRLSLFLKEAITQLREFFELDTDDYVPDRHEALLHCFWYHVKKTPKYSRMLFVIDGLEDLVDDQGGPVGISWIPESSLPVGVFFLGSLTLTDSTAMEYFASSVQNEVPDETFLTQTEDTNVSEGGPDAKNAVPSEVLFVDSHPEAVLQIHSQVVERKWKVCQFQGPFESKIKDIILNFLKNVYKGVYGKSGQLSEGLESEYESRAVFSAPSSSRSNISTQGMHSVCEKEFVLLESHISQLCGWYTENQDVGMIYETLHALRRAAQLDYDVCDMLEGCTKCKSHTGLIQYLLERFSRGNYPTTIAVKKAFEACEKGSMIRMDDDLAKSQTRPLPSTEEMQCRKQIKKILNGESLVESCDVDLESSYADDFDDESNCPEDAENNVQDELDKKLLDIPVYLLGGKKIEPLGDWLCKTLGFLSQARYGLTLEELKKTLSVIPRLLEETNCSLENKPKEESNLDSDAAFEEWLKADNVNKEPTQEDQYKLPKGVEEFLVKVLPVFGVVTVHDMMCMPLNKKVLHDLIEKNILENENYAPTDDQVQLLGKEIIQTKSMRPKEMKKKVREDSSPTKKASKKPATKTREETTLAKVDENPQKENVKSRKCEGHSSDSIVKELANLPSRWRMCLIHVFSKHRDCFRKYEELPRLYQQNERWIGLLNTISDIRGFTCMWSDANVLRRDLQQFWIELSITTSNQADRPHFDPVDLYSHALDDFNVSMGQRDVSLGKGVAPAFKTIAKAIMDLGEFFWWFGENEHFAPTYLHPPLNEADLATIYIRLPHVNRKRLQIELRKDWRLDLMSSSHKLQELGHSRQTMMTEQHLLQRQLVTLDKQEKVTDKHNRRASLLATRRKNRLIRLTLNQKLKYNEETKSRRMAEGMHYEGNEIGENFYSYQRWVWLQFPWMSLCYASSVRIVANNESRAITLPGTRPSVICQQSSFRVRRNPKLQRLDTSIHITKSPSADNFWSRMKQDPRVLRITKKRAGHMMSMPSISSIEEVPSMRGYLDENEEDLDESTQPKGPEDEQDEQEQNDDKQGQNVEDQEQNEEKQEQNEGQKNEEEQARYQMMSVPMPCDLDTNQMDGDLLRRGVGPFLHEAHLLPRNAVPFSSPSVRTLKHGTRFPTFQSHSQDEANRECIFNSGFAEDETMGKSTMISAGVALKTLKVKNLPAHLNGYPATEKDAQLAEANGVVTQFRQDLNSLRCTAEEKEQYLGSLMQLAYDREQEDKYTETCVASGEALIEDLTTRLEDAQMEIKACEHTHKFLAKVVDVCNVYPARHEKHILTWEKRLAEMREDKLSLSKDLDMIRLFNRKAYTEEKPAIEEALKKRRLMQAQVLERLNKLRSSEKSKFHKKADLTRRRQTIISDVQSRQISDTERKSMLRETHRQKLYKAILLQDEVTTQKERVQNHAKNFQRIANVTQCADFEEICNKFRTQKQELASTSKRVQELTQKVKEKKAELKKLKTTKRKVMRQATRSNTSKPERMREKIEQAEERQRYNRMKHNDARTLVDEIKNRLSALERILFAHSKDHKLVDISFNSDDTLNPTKERTTVSQLFRTCCAGIGLEFTEPNLANRVSGVNNDTCSSLAVTDNGKITKEQTKKRNHFLFGGGIKSKCAVKMPPRISSVKSTPPKNPKKKVKPHAPPLPSPYGPTLEMT